MNLVYLQEFRFLLVDVVGAAALDGFLVASSGQLHSLCRVDGVRSGGGYHFLGSLVLIGLELNQFLRLPGRLRSPLGRGVGVTWPRVKPVFLASVANALTTGLRSRFRPWKY